MNDSTADWLAPMLEARESDPAQFLRLLREASMPMAEAADSWMRTFMLQVPLAPGVAPMAVDWIRFGQLLRHELGWDHTYPAWPQEST